MNDFNFFSDSKYIVLPTKTNPKVYLAIGSLKIKRNSFLLYNPFSLKAKLLEKFAFLFPVFNIITKKKTEFVTFIEKQLNLDLVVSTYISTDNDKVILQLQTNKQVFGYLKMGLTKSGNQRVNNEIKALEVLKMINPIKVISQGTYENNSFLITENLEGTIGYLRDDEVKKLTDTLKRDEKFSFNDHPRVKSIYIQLQDLKRAKYLNIFEKIKIEDKFLLVYEHGDFTPWNIVQKDNKFILFDFEYFTENGIEYFDLIKYHYQVETLLHKKKNYELIEIILDKIDSIYSKELFTLFLLNEIQIKSYENKAIEQEDKLINILTEKL